MDHAGDWWTLMWIGMIVMWTLVLASIWAFFATIRSRGRGDVNEDALARRLARGEISRDEYRTLIAHRKDRVEPPQ